MVYQKTARRPPEDCQKTTRRPLAVFWWSSNTMIQGNFYERLHLYMDSCAIIPTASLFMLNFKLKCRHFQTREAFWAQWPAGPKMPRLLCWVFYNVIMMLCIYLTLNLVLPGHPSGRNSYPSGRNSYPSGRNSYPLGRKMLQHAMDFVRSEQLYQSWPQDKYRLIPLASVQLSIKLILSLSLVS